MAARTSRRSFLWTGSIICATVAGAGAITLAQESKDKPRPKRPDPLPYDLVKSFVAAAHGDLDKTRALLDENPKLLNATMDHGGGDFEAAIGGAGHMGRRDIAQFLIDRGARYDVFVSAMMGQLAIVKSMIEAFPATKTSKGPHGISLMAHAQKGGEQAAEVVKYLESIA